MKRKVRNIIALIVPVIIATGCVTGNDDNAVLDDLNSAFSRTPRVTNLLVNGSELERDSASVWIDVMVNAGDEIPIRGILNTGAGATSSTYHITRNYHHTSTSFDDVETLDADIAEALADPDIEDIIDLAPLDGTAAKQFGTGSTEYSLTYTVPSVDDEGGDFISGDHINISFWSTNDQGGVGFVDFTFTYK